MYSEPVPGAVAKSLLVEDCDKVGLSSVLEVVVIEDNRLLIDSSVELESSMLDAAEVGLEPLLPAARSFTSTRVANAVAAGPGALST